MARKSDVTEEIVEFNFKGSIRALENLLMRVVMHEKVPVTNEDEEIEDVEEDGKQEKFFGGDLRLPLTEESETIKPRFSVEDIKETIKTCEAKSIRDLMAVLIERYKININTISKATGLNSGLLYPLYKGTTGTVQKVSDKFAELGFTGHIQTTRTPFLTLSMVQEFVKTHKPVNLLDVINCVAKEGYDCADLSKVLQVTNEALIGIRKGQETTALVKAAFKCKLNIPEHVV